VDLSQTPFFFLSNQQGGGPNRIWTFYAQFFSNGGDFSEPTEIKVLAGDIAKPIVMLLSIPGRPLVPQANIAQLMSLAITIYPRGIRVLLRQPPVFGAMRLRIAIDTEVADNITWAIIVIPQGSRKVDIDPLVLGGVTPIPANAVIHVDALEVNGGGDVSILLYYSRGISH
jgi:hypothetical protein